MNGQNDTHARMLADCGATLPPILVQRSSMRVIDGAHRVRAAILRGQSEIDAILVDSGAEDAFVLAVKANNRHGLPLSLADRRAAAERILNSHPHWSDRAIAAITGLSDKTVGAARRRSAAEIPQTHIRIGRDGSARPLDTSPGRRKAAELLAERPNASLREISAEAGISASTVRDVRDRIRQGQAFVPEQRSPQIQQPRPSASAPTPEAATEGSRVLSKAPTETLKILRSDPSLRLTEQGRLLLRALEAWTVDEGTRDRLAASVPQHCVPLIADLITQNTKAWQQLASQLRQAHEDCLSAE
ncbi:ParB/RepB/Spo0J family partition protein [Actinophytocola algeriensis]|uniref:Uncharacterized protein n=1 Tax=Actinophytocola algeriensis TaxID=1768010 RepID=A0A7W7QDL5_9PSEU|nr:ParB/RepB/Spo0J family partition protein [Actinophytocola algeriensis]MBB4911568.1 hypothetical protein [Actinophytocola algeriensis]MBE1473444.1 hypothetical protein [Actinophytocola algeriensis]